MRFISKYITFFSVIIFYELTYALIVCPTVNTTPVIHLGFSYENSKRFLPGVQHDLKTMKELFSAYPNQTFLTDKDVLNKEDFIKILKSKTQKLRDNGASKPNVIFNYAGHGILTENGGFAIPIPNIPTSCFFEKEIQFEGDPDHSLYRGFLSSSYLDKSRDFGVVKLNECKDQRGLGRQKCTSTKFKKTMTVIDDKSAQCQKYIITSSDFKDIFKDTEIYGMIDACHSGALTKTEGSNFIASALDSEKAGDDPNKGGELFKFVKDLMEKYPCSFNSEGNSTFTLAEILSKLPQATISSNGEASIKSVRGLTRQSLENIYFKKQNPVASQGMESQSNCFPIGSNQKQNLKCESPMGDNYETTTPVSCTVNGINLVLESGEPVVLTNYSVDGKNIQAYHEKCGSFPISPQTHRSLKLSNSEKISSKTKKPDSGSESGSKMKVNK